MELTTTNQTREVAENTPAGTNIGDAVTASDTDVLTYSLNDTGAASFDINRATGQLITKAALDHEGTSPLYTVMVRATDPFNAFVEAQVTITVTDVNEAPSVTGAASIDHAEKSNDAGRRRHRAVPPTSTPSSTLTKMMTLATPPT